MFVLLAVLFAVAGSLNRPLRGPPEGTEERKGLKRTTDYVWPCSGSGYLAIQATSLVNTYVGMIRPMVV